MYGGQDLKNTQVHSDTIHVYCDNAQILLTLVYALTSRLSRGETKYTCNACFLVSYLPKILHVPLQRMKLVESIQRNGITFYITCSVTLAHYITKTCFNIFRA